MTDAPPVRLPVSLIVVSRGRRDALRTLVSALRFQTTSDFELIVVSDQPDTGFAEGLDGIAAIRHRHFDEPNISRARNIGLEMAGGDIVAFCDDDAVPDPVWLDLLTAPFADPQVGQAFSSMCWICSSV